MQGVLGSEQLGSHDLGNDMRTPAAPAGGTERAVADYVFDMHDAHADCRDRFRAVRGLVEAAW